MRRRLAVAFRIYNTLSGQKEDFQPYNPNQVTMYVCGITPYNSSHIGHAMSAIVFDIVRRWLEYKGYKVKHIQNFTDIDDKIINRAISEKVAWQTIPEKYIKEYIENLDTFNVKRPDHYPRATEEVDHIIESIQTLIEKGYGYELNGDVYYRVLKKPEYGELKHQNLEDLRAGARIEVNPDKEFEMDFALWKATKPGEPSWSSPWGEGRPGWHIECSVMSSYYLGEQIDIHGGGADLIFPHHENEIAQSEALTGKRPFVKYWMHNGLLQFSGDKMSKSLGNVLSMNEILEQGDPDTLRFLVLGSLYRNPLTYSEESFEAAKRGLERMKSVFSPVEKWGEPADENGNTTATAVLQRATEATRAGFSEAMDDDINTAQALARLFDLVREIYKGREAGASPASLHSARSTLSELGGVLGLRLEQQFSKSESAEAAPFIDLLVEMRRELRGIKQYALADSVRQRLAALGVVLEDRPDGTTWKFQ
jgi:cysteinyl-tRNA synthetase